jgi:cation-transporting ATPase E
LTDAQVVERVEEGLVNRAPQGAGRTVRQIVAANVLTRFNAILGSLFVVVAVVGPVQDGLFGVILVVNTAIGIVQELRAKRTLDRLAILTAPTATVVRDGSSRAVPAVDVVQDELVEFSAGDQVVVDGEVLTSDSLEVDESLLTGEAEPVLKDPGDEVLSGSFVVSGSGRCQAIRVGSAAYAQQVQAEARRFSLVHSELQQGTNQILRGVTWVMVPASLLLITSQLVRSNQSVAEALRGTVAGVGAMVPEGLVLLTSIAFALGAIRLARRRVLVQELAAIEGLARVDVLCIDKTGTLTEPTMSVQSAEALADLPSSDALGALASQERSPNATLRAIAASYPASPGWVCTATVPFSSARKWSAATFEDQGTWVLGAPDILLTVMTDELAARIRTEVGSGHRVVLLASTRQRIEDNRLPGDLVPAALISLAEQLRPDAASTVSYLLDQGVTVKVLSGDDPRTVGAVATRVGIPLAGDPVDARELPAEGPPLAEAVERAAVFGRVQPAQKRAIVEALQHAGHVVAMTGDGVNDVPALKQADIGMAMGSGSQASRAVGRLVLLDSSFSAVPDVVGEGRRVIANIERVARLFVTKTVWAALLAVVIGLIAVPYPLYPRHLTVVNALTIGIPAFFLALAPGAPRAKPGFVQRVLRFTVPAGFIGGIAALGSYGAARAYGTTLVEARTTATMTLLAYGLWVLVLVARPLTPARWALVALMAGGAVLVITVGWSSRVFSLVVPPAAIVVVVITIVVAAGAALWLILHRTLRPIRSRPTRPK